MGVSRLTGMNSDATSVETHRVSANTAPQDVEREAGDTGAPASGMDMGHSQGVGRA
ncbi:hypothetical protein KH5H1_72980 [Corallococcus caeni]|nr:hypothetical protein KH5H1_72980 [Corallococcus sp. KH5-1]